MSLKDNLKKTVEDIKETGEKITKKVEHTVSEAVHHGAAESEYAKRQALGEEMTPEEKAKSIANEAKHRVQAGVDGVKKNLDDV